MNVCAANTISHDGDREMTTNILFKNMPKFRRIKRLICQIFGHKWKEFEELTDDTWLGSHGIVCNRCGYFIVFWRR